MQQLTSWSIGLSLCIWCLGCPLDDPCDPGQILDEESFTCFTPPSESEGDSNDNGANDTCESEFGKACGDSSECGCDTSFCAAQPGQGGICTVSHCLAKPEEICPSGFTCIDITALAPDLESVCVPE